MGKGVLISDQPITFTASNVVKTKKTATPVIENKDFIAESFSLVREFISIWSFSENFN